jgi:hypothetical protein
MLKNLNSPPNIVFDDQEKIEVERVRRWGR